MKNPRELQSLCLLAPIGSAEDHLNAYYLSGYVGFENFPSSRVKLVLFDRSWYKLAATRMCSWKRVMWDSARQKENSKQGLNVSISYCLARNGKTSTLWRLSQSPCKRRCRIWFLAVAGAWHLLPMDFNAADGPRADAASLLAAMRLIYTSFSQPRAHTAQKHRQLGRPGRPPLAPTVAAAGPAVTGPGPMADQRDEHCAGADHPLPGRPTAFWAWPFTAREELPAKVDIPIARPGKPTAERLYQTCTFCCTPFILLRRQRYAAFYCDSHEPASFTDGGNCCWACALSTGPPRQSWP